MFNDFKAAVRAASTEDINLAAPGDSIDGVVLERKDRVLIRAQSNSAENGIYEFVGASFPMKRAKDANTGEKLSAGTTTFVAEGDTLAGKSFIMTATGPITLGETELGFGELAAPGGGGGGGGTFAVEYDSDNSIVNISSNDIDLSNETMEVYLSGSNISQYYSTADGSFESQGFDLIQINNFEYLIYTEDPDPLSGKEQVLQTATITTVTLQYYVGEEYFQQELQLEELSFTINPGMFYYNSGVDDLTIERPHSASYFDFMSVEEVELRLAPEPLYDGEWTTVSIFAPNFVASNPSTITVDDLVSTNPELADLILAEITLWLPNTGEGRQGLSLTDNSWVDFRTPVISSVGVTNGLVDDVGEVNVTGSALISTKSVMFTFDDDTTHTMGGVNVQDGSVVISGGTWGYIDKTVVGLTLYSDYDSTVELASYSGEDFPLYIPAAYMLDGFTNWVDGLSELPIGNFTSSDPSVWYAGESHPALANVAAYSFNRAMGGVRIHSTDETTIDVMYADNPEQFMPGTDLSNDISSNFFVWDDGLVGKTISGVEILDTSGVPMSAFIDASSFFLPSLKFVDAIVGVDASDNTKVVIDFNPDLVSISDPQITIKGFNEGVERSYYQPSYEETAVYITEMTTDRIVITDPDRFGASFELAAVRVYDESGGFYFAFYPGGVPIPDYVDPTP